MIQLLGVLGTGRRCGFGYGRGISRESCDLKALNSTDVPMPYKSYNVSETKALSAGGDREAAAPVIAGTSSKLAWAPTRTDVKCVSKLDDSARSFFARGAILQWSNSCVKP